METKATKAKALFAMWKEMSIAIAGVMIAGTVGLVPQIAAAQGDAGEPVRYTRSENVDIARPDGGLRVAVGVQNYQVLRSFRNDLANSDGLGWTYHHEPMIHYWNSRIYLSYKSTPKDEDAVKGHVLLSTSSDLGRTWAFPVVLFPEQWVNGKEWTFSAQRMGFWTSPRGRLYAVADYIPMSGYFGGDYCDWRAYGVTIREIKIDGTFGNIYFIADNPSLYSRSSLPFPYYDTAPDETFKADCNTLRADKLVTLAWWEPIKPENFSFPQSLVDFISVKGDRKFGKGISYYHRPDNTVVALWKFSWSALSSDSGASWTQPVQLKTMGAGWDKVWGQKTKDGRYACSWTPRATSPNRYPLIVATGSDGISYTSDMLNINGELYRRYVGRYKDIGPSNYQRGLLENNSADIPGTDMWLTYSMSKEDIWVSRIPVPIRGALSGHVNDSFNNMETGGVVTDWNVYSPKYAPVRVVEFPSSRDKSLELTDRDPFDYAKAERVFPESQTVKLSFKVLAKQASGRLEVEVRSQTPGAFRPVRLWFDGDGQIKAMNGITTAVLGAYQRDIWYSIVVDVDTKAKNYSVKINGSSALIKAGYAESATITSVERLVFRTGSDRGLDTTPVDPSLDHPISATTFYVDDVSSSGPDVGGGRKGDGQAH
jgi:hypothetical protein